MIEVVETNCRSELMMPSLKDQKKTKYKLIYDHLRKEISSGVYQPGSKMPTELELVKRYKSSRTTVAKALRNLEIKGLINRVQGSGTFCSKKNDTISLALLGPREIGDIRDPKTFTIFSQLVFPLSTFASQKNMSFILGNLPATDNNETDIKALQLCDNFIQQDVKCVLFLPLDYAVEDYSINEQITRKLSDANIEVVLLDRDIYDGRTERSDFDIVGIDNVRAAYKATEHLIRHHCKRICIVYEETRNSVIVDRISGYIQAVTDNNLVIHKIKLNEYTDHVTNEIKTKLLSFEGDEGL